MTANKNQPPEPTPRRERRSRTAEADAAAFAWKLLKEKIEKDPKLAERFIAQKTGFDIAKADRDAAMERIKLKLLELAFELLLKHPEWAEDLALDALYEAMGKKRPEPESEEGPHRPTLDEMFETWTRVEDLMNRSGRGRPAAWEQVLKGLFDPKTIEGLVNLYFDRKYGQPTPPPSGTYSSQTPPPGTAEGQATPSGFSDFVHNNSPPPPPSGPQPNPFTYGPSPGRKQEPAHRAYTDDSWKAYWEKAAHSASGEAMKEKPQPQTANDKRESANDVHPQPKAQSETDRSGAASHFNFSPNVEPRSDVNPGLDQSSSIAATAAASHSESTNEPAQSEKTSPLETNVESQPVKLTQLGKSRLSESTNKIGKAGRRPTNPTSVEPPMSQPDQLENHDEVDPKTVVESAPSDTNS